MIQVEFRVRNKSTLLNDPKFSFQHQNNRNMKQLLPILLLLTIWACGSNNNESPNSESEVMDSSSEQVEDNTTQTESTPESEEIKKEFQNGDLIFHTSLSGQSRAIQIASNSKYSHVGIVYKEGNKFFVYEAVQPIKLTPLDEFIKRGKNGHYVLKRVKKSEADLSPKNIAKMKKAGEKYMGKNYDLQFMWSDDKIYCSELAWKIYKEVFDIEIGKLQQIKDFDLSDPVVQKKVKERYGDNVPMEEFIITPDRMFKSDLLITVMKVG